MIIDAYQLVPILCAAHLSVPPHVDTHVDTHIDTHVDTHVNTHVDTHVNTHVSTSYPQRRFLSSISIQQGIRLATLRPTVFGQLQHVLVESMTRPI